MKISFSIVGPGILAASAFVLSAAVPVQAQIAPSNNVCFSVTQIESTRATDRRTILFKLKDGTIWRNTLISDCPDLVAFSAGGFFSVTHAEYICSNQHRITTQSGNVCRLGNFTRVN
jgi:hypothetical protein